MDWKIELDQLVKERLLNSVSGALFAADSDEMVKNYKLSEIPKETIEWHLSDMRKMFRYWSFDKLKEYFELSCQNHREGLCDYYLVQYLLFRDSIAPRIVQDTLSGWEDLLCRNAYRVLKQTRVDDFS